MTPDYAKRVKAIDWTAYETAFGRADGTPDQLMRLASSDHETAMAATHKLWAGLCHQHAYISSAALPACPFLFEVLDSANEALATEILDILAGFAYCSTEGLKGPSPSEWERQLRGNLIEQLPRFVALTQHQDEEIADLAERIVGNLTESVE